MYRLRRKKLITVADLLAIWTANHADAAWSCWVAAHAADSHPCGKMGGAERLCWGGPKELLRLHRKSLSVLHPPAQLVQSHGVLARVAGSALGERGSGHVNLLLLLPDHLLHYAEEFLCP